MPSQKPQLTPKTKMNTGKKKFLLHSKNRPILRPLIVLVAIAVVAIGAWVIYSLASPRQSSFIRTSSYKNGSAGFSFEYPADFNDDTKPATIAGDDSGYVAQQSLNNSEGIPVGFARAIYTPTEQSANLDESLQQALDGNQANLDAFKSQLGSASYGDCSQASLVTTHSKQTLVKCPLAKALAGTDYKGNVFYGASRAGVYEFDYWIQNSYWSAHKNIWGSIYKNISYN